MSKFAWIFSAELICALNRTRMTPRIHADFTVAPLRLHPEKCEFMGEKTGESAAGLKVIT